MFQRIIEKTLKQTVKNFPVTLLTGPRQSGKTTLLKKLYPRYHYINLEAPDLLLQTHKDPRSILHPEKDYFIIDEAQNAPELFSYLHDIIEAQHQPGQFILSGSQNLLLLDNISQSLAGRAAILELLPLTYQEYVTHPELEKTQDVWTYLFHGSYPRPYQEHLDTKVWYTSYIRTYLERDVRSLLNIKDLLKFQLFLKLCAGMHGQLLNLSTLAQHCGISQTTASEWLSVLEASYLVFRLMPYFRNFKKRLVKTPKLYFYDSALVCHLLGIDSPQHLKLHSQRGAIFEGFIITEIIKQFYAKAQQAPIYFWRDQTGIEVDLIIERGEKLVAVEIKSSMTFQPDLCTTLTKWGSITGLKQNRVLIYAGQRSTSFEDIKVLNWQMVHELV